MTSRSPGRLGSIGLEESDFSVTGKRMRKQPKISIIVPVKSMAGKLSNFYTWTIELNTDYELIVVHDLGDLETTQELLDHLEKHIIC